MSCLLVGHFYCVWNCVCVCLWKGEGNWWQEWSHYSTLMSDFLKPANDDNFKDNDNDNDNDNDINTGIKD